MSCGLNAILGYGPFLLALICLQVYGYLTTGSTVTADSWFTPDSSWGNCPTSLVDGVFNTEAQVSLCMVHTYPGLTNNAKSFFDIQFVRPAAVETVLIINREGCCQTRIVGTDLWVGMTTFSLVACNANPRGTGLYSCGGKVGFHLRIQQTVVSPLHYGEIRAYSVLPMATSEFTVTHSAYSSCSVGSENLWLWPVDTLLKTVTMITGYSTCRQSLAGGIAGGKPAYYQVDFTGSRFIHAVTILGTQTSSYAFSQNWKLYVLTNWAYQEFGRWGSTNDSYGKEILIGSSTTSIRIERDDGQELRLFWVGIFSTQTDCSGSFDWSESWQTSPVTLKVPSATTSYIVRAKLGDCPIAHFHDQSATYPNYVTFDSVTQTLSVSPPAGINQKLSIRVMAISNYGSNNKQEQRDIAFDICTQTFTASPASLTLSLEITGQVLTYPLPAITSSIYATITFGLDSNAPSFFKVQGSNLVIDSTAAAGTFSFGVTVTDSTCSATITIAAIVTLYDCRPTGFTLTSSIVKVEFLGLSKIIDWSKNANDQLCGNYDITSVSTSPPLITVADNQRLIVQSTSLSQLPSQTVTITLKRQNSSQTATASLQVDVYCAVPHLLITQLAANTEVKVGIDVQPVRVPFKVDLPCFQPATFQVSNSPQFLQVESLTSSSGNIKIENATGAMHGVYKLQLTATAMTTTKETVPKDFSIFINGCYTSTFVHQTIPNTEIFIQSGQTTGEIRFNEFQHTLGMLGKDCGQTVYRLSLASSKPTPTWVSIDADNKIIKYDVSSMGKASSFAFELTASLEQYPIVAISEPFNITVASSEIKCNQLPPAIYRIGDQTATFAVSYSNQTYATQIKLTKIIQPVFKRQGSDVPQPQFVKYLQSTFSVSSMKFEDVDNYQLGLRIGYQEFPSFQVTCELSLSIAYEPKFSGDKVEDHSVSCDKPMNFTLPEYTDIEKQPAKLAVDFGQAAQLFIFDQTGRRIYSKPEKLSGISQMFPVSMILTDSHGYSSTLTFNLQVSCRIFEQTKVVPKPYKMPLLGPPKPFITQINSSGLLRVQFTRKIVVPTYDIYPELKSQAVCGEKCGRMMNATSDEEQAIQIMNMAQVNRNENTLSLIDVEIVPGIYSNATNLDFTWKCVKFTPESMDIKLNFTQADYVSVFSERDQIILRYNGYQYFKSEDGQTFPADLKLKRTLAPQMDSKLAATLSFVAQTVANTSKTIIVLQFILKLVISQSLQQMFASINKLQILTHLPLLEIAVSANAWSFCASFVSLVNFEIYDFGPLTSRVLALKNDHPYSDSFTDYGYGSRFFIINLSNLFHVFFVFIAGLLLLMCLNKARNRWLLKIRDMLRQSLVWGAFIDYFNEACLPIALSCLIAYQLWSFKSVSEAFDQLCSSSAMIAVFIAVPLFKLLFLQQKRNDLQRPEIKQRFSILFERLRFKRTRWALVEPFISDLRRLILAVTIIHLQRYPTFQLISLYFEIITITIFNGEVEPFADPTTARLEQFNELAISGVFYHLLCFTDLVKDPAIRMKIGWSMIATTLFCLTVNFVTVLSDPIRNIIKRIKLYRRNKKQAKQRKRQQRIDEERQKQLFKYYEDLKNEQQADQTNPQKLDIRVVSVSSLEDAQEFKQNQKTVVEATIRKPTIQVEESKLHDISGFKIDSPVNYLPDISNEQSSRTLIPLAQRPTRSELAKRFETTMLNVDVLLHPAMRNREWKLDEADFAAYEKFLGRKIQ